MSDHISKGVKNYSLILIGQIIPVILQVIMSLAIPFVMADTPDEYRLWQWFLLIFGYLGFFHFGIIDGLFLRYGGQELDEKHLYAIKKNLHVVSMISSIVSVVGVIIALIFAKEADMIIISVSLSLVLFFVLFRNFFQFIFQGIMQVKTFLISLMLEKLITLIFMGILVILKVTEYEYYIAAYCIGIVLACLYLFIKSRKVIFAEKHHDVKWRFEVLENAKRGLPITFSYLARIALLGFSKIIIDNVFGESYFNEFSFAYQMVNLIIVFLGAMSIVLFPMLNTVSKDNLKSIYYKIKDPVMLLFYIVLLCTPIVFLLINEVYSEYTNAVTILALMAPIIVYEGKIQVVSGTFLKVIKQERKLAYANITSFVLGIIAVLIFGFVLDSFSGIVISIAAAIVLKSLIIDVIIAKKLEMSLIFDSCLEIIPIVAYIIGIHFFSDWFALIYGVSLLIFIIIKRKVLIEVFKMLLNVFRRGKK